MTHNVSSLLMLAVFSGLSMNLILQFGLGLKEIAFDSRAGSSAGRKKLLTGSTLLFITVMLLWLIFSFARSIVFLGLFEYILVFPAGFLIYAILEYVTSRFILEETEGQNNSRSTGNAVSGGTLTGAALFITLNVAGGLREAAMLSLGFSCGMALVCIIVDEIRRRSEMEAVPRFLRGSPLTFIAMGLLSLVFVSGALMFFEALGAK